MLFLKIAFMHKQHILSVGVSFSWSILLLAVGGCVSQPQLPILFFGYG